MRKEYTLSQRFALIGLDGQSASHSSVAKRAAVRGIAAAVILERFLYQEEENNGQDREPEGRIRQELAAALAKIKHLNQKKAKDLEKEVVRQLEEDGVLEEVPDLLGCDMTYVTSGIHLTMYRSDEKIWLSLVEQVKGEILEDGPVTLECVCLLWLLRESGCIHEIFSVREQERVQERMTALSAADRFYDFLWKQEFHKDMELAIRSFLKGKRKLFRNPYLAGINLLFPFLDRRQSIFIDFVILGTDVKQRRQAVENYLSEQGHYVEEVRRGNETLIRINNMYYRIWPKTVVVGRVPVQGASLTPVYQ